MFCSILVPLDGSAFAEQALPLATDVACRAGAALNLMRVHILYALNEPACAWLPFDPAAALARLLGARCTLLRVVEVRPQPLAAPAGGELPLDPCVGEARSYLHGVAEKLSEQSLPADIHVVVAPHAAVAILEAAQGVFGR